MDMSDEQIDKELEHQQEVFRILTENMRDLEKRDAKVGLERSLLLANEIRDTHGRLEKCKAEIIRLEALIAKEQLTPDIQGSTMPESDVWLRFWVFMAEKYDIQLSVTLLVNGMLVSGTIISSHSYYDLLMEFFSRVNIKGTDNPEGYKDAFLEGLNKSFKDIKTKNLEPSFVERRDDINNYSLIHLRNARVWQPTKPFNDKEGTLWRLQLSTVNGFTFGTPFTD